MDILDETMNLMVEESKAADLNFSAKEFLDRLDKRITNEYIINGELYDEFGDIQLTSNKNNKLGIFIYRDSETNQISVTLTGPDVREFFDTEDEVVDFINKEMSDYFRRQDGLKDWINLGDELEQKYSSLYNKYTEKNPDNHLSYLDWFTNLPMSYKNEVENSLK